MSKQKEKKIEKLYEIIKCDDNTTFEFPEPELIDKRRIVDKINEIIDYLNSK